MNIGEMAIVAVAIAQALKELLRTWFKVEGKSALIIVVVVCAGVVGYKFITEKLAFDLANFLIMLAEVGAIAIGGKLTASSIAKKVRL